MSNYFEIGKIVNTHGVRGIVKVKPMTDDIKRFNKLKTITVRQRGKDQEYHISKVQFNKDMVLLTLEEVTDMDQAIALKNSSILISKDKALPLRKDEYYIGDLHGLEVFTEDNELLGVVKDVIFTGANEVYVVEREEGKDLLIPAIKACIKDVQIENKKMIVHLLEGLLDL